MNTLNAKDFWLRFECQYRGSPHVHDIAWLKDGPDVKKVLSLEDPSRKEFIRYINKTMSASNPAVLPDGSNVSDAPPPKVNLHICNKPYSEVEDHTQDLHDLIATCQRHTKCSAAYCLHTKNGIQECHFHYPKPLQPEPVIVQTEEDNHEPVVMAARNDGLINSYNPNQLSTWRGNVDM